MGERKRYDIAHSRIPVFTERFRKTVDALGGVSAVSEKTGISRPTINFWYNGERTPDAESLITLSKSLGISADWLLGLLEENNSTNVERIRSISEYTGLSNESVRSLVNANLLAIGGTKATNALISSPRFLDIVSYLSTYFYGTWTGQFDVTLDRGKGKLTIKRFEDKALYDQYVRPAMLSKITEALIEIKKDEEGK